MQVTEKLTSIGTKLEMIVLPGTLRTSVRISLLPASFTLRCPLNFTYDCPRDLWQEMLD